MTLLLSGGGKRKVGAEEIPVFGEKGGFSRHDMGFSCGADGQQVDIPVPLIKLME